MSEDARQRAESLRRLIQHHTYQYYVLDAPEIPHSAWGVRHKNNSGRSTTLLPSSA
jgi:NAD-dependent DNA ligase